MSDSAKKWTIKIDRAFERLVKELAAKERRTQKEVIHEALRRYAKAVK